MAKQLNVNLAFSANTGQAKAQIQELQAILNKIMHTGSTTTLKGIDATKIQQAASAAKELQMHLNNAFNANTGKFDLSQLDKSLKASGSNITDLSTKLLNAGSTGQQAFMKLAQSISLADQPMLRINNKLNEFATTLKNTARWQLSSSMLHGFMGAVQSAYGYAQDLNESLTNIRIVTGQNAEQMAEFAEQANKAAKTLSTTTTDYTNASLIYYQQGLTDDEVIERTNVTIKMANAAGESAQTVSDQMTAVWNNFAKGGENLEYYADVMTALGAATASSTSEISEGLEKFASVAETVGLSYEYATSALATVTATTRQSADIVGTAFKTLFARIQDLELGKTLDDGTTLGQYSKALESVGVNIKDANGEIKGMDIILEEMAAKWQTLAKDQQVSLAQSVAGVRQYTQLIALMDNWDFMQENLETAYNSTGTLTEQAEIYAESWEAASKRVKASAEGLYQSLLDDDFFIVINNGFANMLTGLDAFIDGAGGLKTVIVGISSIIISNFANKIPEAIQTAKYNIDVLTKGSAQAYQNIQKDMQMATETMFTKHGVNKNSSLGFMVESSNQLATARTQLASITDRMSASERQMAETELNLMQQTQQEVYALQQKKEALQSNIETMQSANLSTGSISFDDTLTESFFKAEKAFQSLDSYKLTNLTAEFKVLENASGSLVTKLNNELVSALMRLKDGDPLEDIKIDAQLLGQEFTDLKNLIASVDLSTFKGEDDITDARNSLMDLIRVFPEAITNSKSLKSSVEGISKAKSAEELKKRFEEFKNKLNDCKLESTELARALKTIQNPADVDKFINDLKDIHKLAGQAEEKIKNFNSSINNFQPTHIIRTSEAFGSLAGLAGNTATIINSVSSAFKNLTNPDLSGWEKFSSLLMAFSFTVPTVISAMKSLGTVNAWTAAQNLEYIATQTLLNTTTQFTTLNLEKQSTALALTTAAQAARAGATKQEIIALVEKRLIEEEGMSATAAHAMAEEAATLIENGRSTSLVALIGLKMADIVQTKIQNTQTATYNVLMAIANALTGKFGALWQGIAAGAIIGGIVLAVGTLVKILDNAITTETEANEAMSESISKWKEAKDELESLNSELETTRDRIAELEAMDSLSIVEQEELDKLYEQEASLERQVALQEQLAKGERVKVADDFEDNFKSLKRGLSTEPEDTTRTFYDAGQEQLTPEQYKAKYIDSLYNEDGSIDENNVALAKQREEYYQQWLIDEEQSRAKWLAEHQESLTKTEEGYLAWLEVNGDTATEDQKKEYAQIIQDSYKKGLGEEGYQDLVESQTKQSRKEEEERLGLSFGDIIDRDLAKEGATAESAAKNLANSFSESFKNELYSKGMVPEDYAQDLVDQAIGFEEKINKALSDSGSNVTLDEIKKDDRFKDEDLEILTKIKITGEDDLNSIFEKIEQYKNNELAVNFNASTWGQETAQKQAVVEDLEIGDTISTDDFAILGDAYKEYFELQNDGTYRLIASAEDLKAAIDTIESKKALENIKTESENINKVENSTMNTVSAQELWNEQSQLEAGDRSAAAMQRLESYKAKVEEVYGIECESIQEAIDIMVQHNEQLSATQGALFNSATSVSELRSRLSEVQEVLGYTDYNSYTDALIGLAANYENCSEEITEFQNALATGNEPLIAEKEHQLETAAAIGEVSKEYGIEADVVEDVADGFLEMAEAGEEQYQILKEDAEALKDASVRYVRLQEALDDLNSNYDNYKDVLKDVQDSTNDVDRAMAANSKEGKNLQKSLAGLLGTTEDLIDADLLAAIDPKDFKKAAQGDEAAIERIRNAFVKLQAEANGIDFEGLRDELAGLEEGVVVDINADTMPLLYKLIEAKVAAGAGAAEIESLLSGMNIDADVSDFVGSMNEMAAASASASSEVIANTSFSQEVEATEVETPTTHEDVGFQETYTPTEISKTSNILKDGAEETVPVKETYHQWTKTVTPIKESETANDTQQAVSTKTTNGKGQTSQVKGVKISNAHKSSGGKVSGNRKGRSTGGGGGGGGGGSSAKPEKVDKTKKSDVVERYKRINDRLDDTKNKMEDASRAAERLYGKNRIKQMKEVSKQLDKEVKLLKQKKEEAEGYLKTDKTALKNAAKKAGVTFTFDDEGNIKNYEAQMEKLYERLAAAEKKADPSNFKTKEKQDAYIEKNVTPLKEKIEALKEAISQYDETRELIEDLDDEAQEKFNEWQDNNFEILNYELELKLEVDDAELRKLEYLLSKIEDDFYSMAEAGALMIGKATKDADGNVTGLNDDGSQLDVYIDKFGDLQDQRDALKESFQKGEISEAAYIEGLQNLEDQAYDNAEAIQDLDNTMMHYYGDTLEAAQEELSKYTDMMDQHVEVLEHYANVMDIIGKSTDYKSMGEILEAQAEVAENNLAVSKANYQILDEQRKQRKDEYEAAIGKATDEELAVLKQKWLDAEAAANDAQDEMMADAEEWAESLRAVVENKLAGLAQSLEKTLTADFGGSFDQMSAQMERARDLQEEYLTDTNKIYETNKLINKAQQDIDKTTNTVAKKRLQNYIKETEQLQNKAKLSNYELEIQQAKYDLVLAEIALEEAQNAKSTVRLQRDAEGNFGYVYTADSSKVAEAEQQLADAQNRLYNIGLEGANDYTEKYQQTLAEMYDTLTELQTQYLEGAFASEEEYNTAVANAKEYYYAKLAQYSDLYTIALTTDSAVREDAWSTDFDDMIYSTDKWQQSVNEYLGNVQSVFTEWEKQVAKIREETVGKDLDALKQKTKDIKDESKKLKDQIADPKDGVIKAIKDEIEEVNKLTNAYAKARKQIKGTQTDHENFIKELRESIENPDKDKKKEDPVVPKKEEEPKKEDPQPTTPKTDAIDYDRIKKGTKVEVKSGQKWYYDSYGTSPTGTARDGTIKYINRDGTHPFNIEGLGWIKQSAIKKVVKYDTGGYTGSWGPQGKLAMLHEKELILNKHDTENFLASMDVLDRILQAIDLRAMSSQLGGILTSPTFGGQMKEEHLEQNVTIEANFPGVSMASEIEEAFENIVNLASQYANRK